MGCFFNPQACTYLFFQVSKVATPTRKHKAAAMRGAPPKRRKTDIAIEKPESSKANEEEKNKTSDVQNVGLVTYFC